MDYKIPNHVAIIMDGNGRWAQKRGLKRTKGHQKGAKVLKKISEYVYDKKIKVLSVFAFSTENWKRDKEEVDYLMDLFIKVFKDNFKSIKEKGVKIVFSGVKTKLNDKVLKEKAEQLKACLANRLKDYNVEIEESFAQIGSGSQPMATIPSLAVTIAEKTEAKLTALLAIFKALEQPIIGRVEKGKIWLDLRSVADFKALLDTVEKL